VAAVVHSSFSALLYILCTWHLDLVTSRESPCKLFDNPTQSHYAHCLHLTQRVGFRYHPTLSKSGLCCALHQEPGKNGGSKHSEFVGELPVWKMPPWILPAFSFALRPLTCVWNSTVSLPPFPFYVSAIYCTSRTVGISLSDETCSHRVYVGRHLCIGSSSSRRSLLDWTTPVKSCSIVICMLINDSL